MPTSHSHHLRPLLFAFIGSAMAALTLIFLQHFGGFQNLRAQTGGRPPINVFSEEEAARGFIAKHDEHNLWHCASQPASSVYLLGPIAKATENTFRAWAYEFTGEESARRRQGLKPVFNGPFWISKQQIEEDPRLASLNTLTKMVSGRMYYLMTEKNLLVKCDTGIEPVYACGNGDTEPAQNYAHLNIAHPAEECDDGNTIDTDGCSNTCQVQTCTDTDGGKNHAVKGTISGKRAGGDYSREEQCADDGRHLAEYFCDGTAPMQEYENGDLIVCRSGCRDGACISGPVCGNGTVESPETCDDGNTRSGDGCSDTCTEEFGFSCDGEPSVCEPFIPGLPPPGNSSSSSNTSSVGGGGGGHTSCQELQWYEVGSNALPIDIHASATVTSAGAMFEIGGSSTNGFPRDVLRSTNGASWNPVALNPLPFGVFNHTAAILGNAMYVVGGRKHPPGEPTFTSYFSNNVIASADAGKTWRNVGYLPISLSRHQTVTIGNTMFVIGGETPMSNNVNRYVDTVYASTDGVRWETVGHLPVTLSYHVAAVFQGKIIVAGGGSYSGVGNEVPNGSIFISEDGGRNWRTERPRGGFPFPMGMHSAKMVPFDGALWLIGGYDGLQALKDVYTSLDGINWRKSDKSALPEGVSVHTAVALGTNVFVIGGHHNTPPQPFGSRKVYAATCAAEDGSEDCSQGNRCNSNADCHVGSSCVGAMPGGPMFCYNNGCPLPP